MNRRTFLSLLAAVPCASVAPLPARAQDGRPAPAKDETPIPEKLTVAPVGVPTRIPVDQLPSVPELPDPFLFADGTRVKTPADWPRRQAELKQLIQTYEYGHLPPAPPPGGVRVTEDAGYDPPKRKAPATRPGTKPPEEAYDYPAGTRVTNHLITVAAFGEGMVAHAAGPVSFHMVLAVPPGRGPFPAIVRGDLCWGRVRPEIAAEVARRGYVLAEFDRTEIVPDKKAAGNVALRLAHPGGDFSATAAWAWGFHRVIDYLLTRGDVARDKVTVTGHSRGGKTAILAGLMDDRVALTVPNNSGCGGAGCFRHQAPKSEDIAAILKNFPYWFQPQFGQFVGKVDRLPIDQHSVKAAIAPRALLSCEALGDLWANPEGSQVSHSAAKEVYDFLGVGDRIGITFREGKHEQNLDDWRALLAFADRLFLGKPADRRFDQLAFADAPKPWSWRAPGMGKVAE